MPGLFKRLGVAIPSLFGKLAMAMPGLFKRLGVAMPSLVWQAGNGHAWPFSKGWEWPFPALLGSRLGQMNLDINMDIRWDR